MPRSLNCGKSSSVPRRIAILVDRSTLPDLEPGYGQTVKTTVTTYWSAAPQDEMMGTAVRRFNAPL